MFTGCCRASMMRAAICRAPGEPMPQDHRELIAASAPPYRHPDAGAQPLRRSAQLVAGGVTDAVVDLRK
jgi:hypothetical protein